MASQFASKEERHKMNDIFKAFDKNNDGILSREELIQGFLIAYNGNLERATVEVDFILSKLDLNGSGEVDYSGKYMFCLYCFIEFLLATINL